MSFLAIVWMFDNYAKVHHLKEAVCDSLISHWKLSLDCDVQEPGLLVVTPSNHQGQSYL